MNAVPPLPPVLPEGPREDPHVPLLPVWRAAAKHRHLTIPAAVPAAFLAAGAAAAGMHAPVETATAGAGALLAVHLKAPHKWDRTIEQWYARLSVAAAGGWLTTVSLTGLNWPEVAVLGAGSLAWGVPFWMHKRPRSRRLSRIVAEWDRWWRYYAPGWGLEGSEVTDVTTKGVIDTLRVQLHAGKQSVHNIEQNLHLIESALRGHVAPRMTRTEADPRDPSQVLIHLKRKNPLAREITWDGSLLSSTVAGEAPVGYGEGGDRIWAPQLANYFILGATGSGKSNMLNVMLAARTKCPDARVWLIDRKGGKSTRPWLPAADWVAVTVEEARLMLRAARDEIRARALDAYDGNETLAPTDAIPALFIVVDEAHNVTSPMGGDRECMGLLAEIASEGRASAVHVIVLTQYGALMESVGTEQTRSNLRHRICFAVTKPEHGAFALTDWDKLDASRLENAGEFYYQAGPKADSAPGRAPHIPHSLAQQIAAEHALIPRRPLRLFAVDHQETYDTRSERLPQAFRTGRQEAIMIGTESPAEAAARIEEELAELPDAPGLPPLPPDDVLTDEMTRRKQLFARLISDAPPGGIRPVQLRSATGFSSGWTSQMLAALAEHGAVSNPSRGRWLPVAGQDIWQVMETIREERARFAAEAKEKVSA